MKKACLLAFASLFVSPVVHAISLNDIQLWTGSGTNRAALVVQWNVPVLINNTNTVPPPVAEKTMVWGYRFNGTVSGEQMFNTIVGANPRLYAIENFDQYGANVDAIGYNLNGTGIAGVSDGTKTDGANAFTNGILVDAALKVDRAYSLNSGDLYWSGHYGPYWQLWNELNDNGGFLASPNRGTNAFMDPDSYTQGQWASADDGLSGLVITNGSWLGFSVSADGYTTNEPGADIFTYDEQAPPSPDGTYVAYVYNTNDFAVQVISSSQLNDGPPYNDPTAILGRPTLNFTDPYDFFPLTVTDRVTLIDPPFNTTPTGSSVITEIDTDGQITVKMGRKVFANPDHPYGADLIVYGNSFFSAGNISSLASDNTDLNMATLSSGFYGYPTTVSVSQDGVHWFVLTNEIVDANGLFPDEAYRWDDTNDSWTDEQMNPTKPLDPAVYTANLGGESVATGLDQFAGSAGGSTFSLESSGLSWIQYVSIAAPTNDGDYTVIDAIAAVDPVVVGDALSISPTDPASGMRNLFFQDPALTGRNLITLNFGSVSAAAKVYTVGLHEFSSFAPVIGTVSSAYQIMVRPMTGSATPSYVANVSLGVADSYTGTGSDLQVYLWKGTNWVSQPFDYSASDNEVTVPDVTNLSAFVVSQVVLPQLDITHLTNGYALNFIPVANCPSILQRSTNLLTWTQITSFTAATSAAMTLEDTNAPASRAFYRLLLNP